MTPLERAARAVAKENCDTDRNWQLWLDDARAVLLAIREPSGGQIHAGGKLSHFARESADAGPLRNLNAIAIYHAMIDKALEEG